MTTTFDTYDHEALWDAYHRAVNAQEWLTIELGEDEELQDGLVRLGFEILSVDDEANVLCRRGLLHIAEAVIDVDAGGHTFRAVLINEADLQEAAALTWVEREVDAAADAMGFDEDWDDAGVYELVAQAIAYGELPAGWSAEDGDAMHRLQTMLKEALDERWALERFEAEALSDAIEEDMVTP